MERILIELTVRNRPGVMSRIAGTFSRRAVNIEEIAVMKSTADTSRMVLLVLSGARTMTVIRELSSHYDVISSQWREYACDSIFSGKSDLPRLQEAAAG